MTDTEKREYFRELIHNLESQQKYVLLYITFTLALLAVVFNRFFPANHADPLTLSTRILWFLIFAGLGTSALCNFVWVGFLNRLSVKAIDYLVTLDLDDARRIHYPGESFYHEHGWVLRLAKITLTIGVLACIGLIGSELLQP
jgi:hypothetical protein